MPSHNTKSRRVTQACDFCHRRGVKCKVIEPSSHSDHTTPCQTCTEYGEICTRNRKPRKRGTKQQNQSAPSESIQISQRDNVLAIDFSTSSVILGSLKNNKVVTALLDVYLDTVHPTFPLFCEREICVGWRDEIFPGNSSEYMNLVCMCALSALHTNNRALFTDTEPVLDKFDLAQNYLKEAETLVSNCPETCGLVERIRSFGFLALVGAQSGNSTLLHKYLGLFHTMSSRFNFHDEANWPADLTTCEKEVRRRLWWAMYRLEVHTACMFGTMIRCSETQCDVGYPLGLHHPAFVPGRDGDFEDWFSGWNLTTDLYRLLEHTVLGLRFRRRKNNSILQNYCGPDISQVMNRLSALQGQILPQFESVASRSSDNGRNRCGFQTCNIICTIHLARIMASLASQEGIEVACQAAREMMLNMNSIPQEYIRATGSPLLQQLAGVGYMLLLAAKRDKTIVTHYSVFTESLKLIVEFVAQFCEFSKTAVDAKDRLDSGLQDLDKYVQSLGAYETLDMTLSSQDSIFATTSDLDMTLLDGAFHHNDFMNANLLKGFAWPEMPVLNLQG